MITKRNRPVVSEPTQLPVSFTLDQIRRRNICERDRLLGFVIDTKFKPETPKGRETLRMLGEVEARIIEVSVILGIE
jgi:hypothetical protein